MKRTNWLSPLNIPEGKIGNFAIEHEIVPPNIGVMFNTGRTMMFGQGTGPANLTWPHETTWHHLLEDGMRWMTDYPIEQRQHDECLEGFKGHVLVGGLGIGYAAQSLALRKEVKSVTVVEISPEVCTLVAPHLKGKDKIVIVNADLLVWLQQQVGSKKKVLDCAFYDIWRSDGEATFHGTVVPLHQLSKSCVKRTPVCWNEGVMRGQLFFGLHSKLLRLYHPEAFGDYYKNAIPLWENDGTDKPWHNWSVPYFQWLKSYSPSLYPSIEKAQEKARTYCSLYGTANWEIYWDLVKSEMP